VTQLKRWSGAFCALILFVFLINSAQAATIIHSNDVMGDIEPCGCRNNPQGGMARKQNLINRTKDPFIVQVDAGDLLFPSQRLPQLLIEQSKVQAGYLLKAMELAHHDVVVPGEKDFALGVDTFEKLIKKSKIHFIAANLVRKNGKPFLKSHVILTGKDEDGKEVRIAVFGLVGEALDWPKSLKATSMLAAAKKEVEALKKKADFLVAVTHQGLDGDKKLAKKVPGIDFIFGGHSQSFLQTPIQVGSTTIFQSSFKNQYVGVVPLARPFKNEQYSLVGLDPGYESPADAPSPMDLLVKEFKKAIADMNSRQESAVESEIETEESQNGKKFQTFSQCAGCHLKQFDFWLRRPMPTLSSLFCKSSNRRILSVCLVIRLAWEIQRDFEMPKLWLPTFKIRAQEQDMMKIRPLSFPLRIWVHS